MNYPLPPKPIGPEDFSLVPHWDGSLLFTINGIEYRLPLNTARLLSQKLITESLNVKRLVLADK